MSAPSPARRAAYEVLRRCFEHGAWADRALPAAAKRHGLEGRERAQAQRLAYGAVQRRGTTDALAERLGSRPVAKLDGPVAAALRLGLYELLFAGGSADHAVVDEAVELAKRGMSSGGPSRARAASGAVNAVLRRAARERSDLLASLEDSNPAPAALAHSVPLWLAELWFAELGADSARALLAAVNEPSETAIRINTLRADPARFAASIAAAGETLIREHDGGPLWPAAAYVVPGPLGPAALAALNGGEAVAQSRAAQAAVALLDPLPGERVLDLCAGPGMKTSAIAARMRGEGELVAIERDRARGRQIGELCERLGARPSRVLEADALTAELGSGYDRIMVDPPCSDLGTLAARPDARWRKTPATITELATIQAGILARAAAALRPGGTLVYSTCTISRAENEAVIARALAATRGLEAEDLGAEHPRLASPHDRRFLQTRPDRDRTDGFFFARLRRAPA